MPQPVHNAIVTPHNDPHLCLKPLSISFYRLTAVQFTTYRPTTPRGEGAVGKIKAGSDT